MNRKIKSGFTLVEILIVVIILGILAAIVIPQFTNASQDARISSVASVVQTLRSQIELFKLQHGDQIPTLATSWDDMITQTAFNGRNFGPYMQSTPTNPMVTAGSTLVTDGDVTTAPDGTYGWVYDQTGATGKLWGVVTRDSGTTWELIGD